MYSILIIKIQNSIKDSLKIRQRTYHKLESSKALRMQDNSVVYLFHNDTLPKIKEVCQFVKEAGGSACIINIDVSNSFECIRSSIKKEIEVSLDILKRVIRKAKTQKQQKKSKEQIEHELMKLSYYNDFLSEENKVMRSMLIEQAQGAITTHFLIPIIKRGINDV